MGPAAAKAVTLKTLRPPIPSIRVLQLVRLLKVLPPPKTSSGGHVLSSRACGDIILLNCSTEGFRGLLPPVVVRGKEWSQRFKTSLKTLANTAHTAAQKTTRQEWQVAF